MLYFLASEMQHLRLVFIEYLSKLNIFEFLTFGYTKQDVIQSFGSCDSKMFSSFSDSD